jgi:hypothetical protein
MAAQMSLFMCSLTLLSSSHMKKLEQRESGQLPNCFSKLTIRAEKPTVDIVGAFSLTNEQSICDLKKLNDGENFMFENEDISRLLYWFSKDLKCRTCDDEAARGDEEKLWDKPDFHSATGNSINFFLWDPGVSPSLHSNESKPHEEFGYVVIPHSSCLKTNVVHM